MLQQIGQGQLTG